MRVIAHISDLHFGHNDPFLSEGLRRALYVVQPTLVVVSGDLVEHATENEFRDARQFLDTLPHPQIVVPGNHDLPFYNLFRRFTEGLTQYRKFITAEREPSFIDEEIAVIGADSAHLYPVKGGKITNSQLNNLVARFSALPQGLIRVLVTHHPFDLPQPSNPHLLIGHARRAVTRLAPVVDILLAGHVHVSSAGSTSNRYKLEEHAMAFVQAGTAISDRHKGETNSFNVLHTGCVDNREKQVVVHRYGWMKDKGQFLRNHSVEYRLGNKGWAQVSSESSIDSPSV